MNKNSFFKYKPSCNVKFKVCDERPIPKYLPLCHNEYVLVF